MSAKIIKDVLRVVFIDTVYQVKIKTPRKGFETKRLTVHPL
jgi:hypothetical protein